MKFLNKPAKGKMGALALVFLWIILWNILYQASEIYGIMEKLPCEIISWAFFISVTIFFMQEELTMGERFLHTLVGGAVGLLCAAGFVLMYSKLAAGLPRLAAISIPLALAIGGLLFLNPICPMVFNNVGFCYFIISLIDAKNAVAELPELLISLALGSVILNLGCIALLKLYGKAMKKKAAK